MSAESREELRAALAKIGEATKDNVARSREIQSRVEWLLGAIDEGQPIVDLIEQEPRPLVVELVTLNIGTLQTIGSRLRQAEARALRAEGLTMEAIADLWGVTRQRVSALLRQGT